MGLGKGGFTHPPVRSQRLGIKNESPIRHAIHRGTNRATTFHRFLSRLSNNQVGLLLESISSRSSFKTDLYLDKEICKAGSLNNRES